MKIAIISTPYVRVPPQGYGGTELIVGLITESLVQRGHDVALYATGDSQTSAKLKALYEKPVWPPENIFINPAVEVNHVSWALREAQQWGAEVIHTHCALGLALTRFVEQPQVYTIHHVWEEEYYQYYCSFPEIEFVAISDFQRRTHKGIARIRTIHHGLDLSKYEYQAKKGDYLLFLGRIAAVKGTHLAIEAARQAGIQLKIAGDIQPVHRDYYAQQVEPEIDGKWIEYLGEADHKMKVELLKGARALLFPIQWDEPFGLVMIESMACGTPVIAFPYGSVPEVVKDGISGYIVSGIEQMAKSINRLDRLSVRVVRDYVERYFSVTRMVDQYEALFQQVATGEVHISRKVA
ncbi:MAG: glycosyltransferase family 4 protein [Acidobacteriota bacterium]